MRPADFIPATFSFTPAARTQVVRIRGEAEAQRGGPIGAIGFAWGHVKLTDGSEHTAPVIGIYDRTQMDKSARASVQTVDGIDLIVFSTPDESKNFEGRTIDFTAERGFFISA